MYKKPLEICCYVAGAGAFGVFFRWLQDQLAFDENGLNEKSFFNFLVPALVIAAVFLFRSFIKGMQRRQVALLVRHRAKVLGGGFAFHAGEIFVYGRD